jgi:hypothetical protein
MCWGYQLLIIASTKRPRTDQQKNCHGQSLEKKKGRTINFDVKENHKEQTIPVLHLCIATVREHLLINFINQFQQFLFLTLEQWSQLLHKTWNTCKTHLAVALASSPPSPSFHAHSKSSRLLLKAEEHHLLI